MKIAAIIHNKVKSWLHENHLDAVAPNMRNNDSHLCIRRRINR